MGASLTTAENKNSEERKVKSGVRSVMIDGSQLPFEQNVTKVAAAASYPPT